jgi:hypothetical protein
MCAKLVDLVSRYEKRPTTEAPRCKKQGSAGSPRGEHNGVSFRNTLFSTWNVRLVPCLRASSLRARAEENVDEQPGANRLTADLWEWWHCEYCKNLAQIIQQGALGNKGMRCGGAGAQSRSTTARHGTASPPWLAHETHLCPTRTPGPASLPPQRLLRVSSDRAATVASKRRSAAMSAERYDPMSFINE